MNTPTPTPTPRTDAAWSASFEPCEYRAAHTARTMRDCSQQLETELTTLTAERDQLRAEVKEAHVATQHWYNRTELAEAELKEWSLLNLWGGTPEIIHAFVKGQQARIHATQDMEVELAAEREKVRVLRSALENLCDEQNGPPLETRRDQWQLAMDEARAVGAAMKEDAK